MHSSIIHYLRIVLCVHHPLLAFKGYFLLRIIQVTKDFVHTKFFVFLFCGLLIGLISVIKHNHKISADLCSHVVTVCR